MPEIFQASGIYEDGYGTIPRMVLIDYRLSIGAKGLYAYLCSYAGPGRVAFPFRDKISNELNISYHTLNKFMNELINLQYIERKQKIKAGGAFGPNIYTLKQSVNRASCIDILEHVSGYVSKPAVLPPGKEISIDYLGYGKVPKLVMKDKTISIKGKAAFAYIACNNNWGNSKTYRWKNFSSLIDVSKNTYFKLIQELLAAEYILKVKDSGNQFDKPVYMVNDLYDKSSDPCRSNKCI